MIEPTLDPYTNIINRTSEYIEYENTDGKKWRIYGNCIACGLCENKPEIIPFVVYEKCGDITRKLIWNAEPGIPGACVEEDYDKRKDIPITPDLPKKFDKCTFKGVWINGN